MSDLENIPTPPDNRDSLSEDIQFNEQTTETRESKGEGGIPSSTHQVKAIQKEEAQYRKNDERLIKVLLLFIKQGNDDILIALINALLERNVPAPFIVGCVSLMYEEVINAMSESEQVSRYEGEDIQEILSRWYQDLTEICRRYPERILPMISHDNYKADEYIKKLLQYVIVALYNKHNIAPNEDQITGYVDTFFEKLIADVDLAIKSTKSLKN
jgi:hypothetical protein